jgi:hypothetical protein
MSGNSQNSVWQPFSSSLGQPVDPLKLEDFALNHAEVLDVSGKHWNTSLSKSVSQVIATDSNVKTLDMGECALGDEGRTDYI